jgi:hypothetical protein
MCARQLNRANGERARHRHWTLLDLHRRGCVKARRSNRWPPRARRQPSRSVEVDDVGPFDRWTTSGPALAGNSVRFGSADCWRALDVVAALVVRLGDQAEQHTVAAV